MLLGAVAAGALTVSSVAAGQTTSAKKPTHKSSASKNGAHSASAPGKTSTHKTTHSSTGAATSTHSSASTRSTKMARAMGSRRSPRTKKVKGQMSPTPERIMEIQEALGKKGVLNGAPSGEWDDSTVAAMKQFQTSNGLNPTGKLDALTLQRLGLGSETAGLAAPIPPPNSQNRLRNLSPEAAN